MEDARHACAGVTELRGPARCAARGPCVSLVAGGCGRSLLLLPRCLLQPLSAAAHHWAARAELPAVSASTAPLAPLARRSHGEEEALDLWINGTQHQFRRARVRRLKIRSHVSCWPGWLVVCWPSGRLPASLIDCVTVTKYFSWPMTIYFSWPSPLVLTDAASPCLPLPPAGVRSCAAGCAPALRRRRRAAS